MEFIDNQCHIASLVILYFTLEHSRYVHKTLLASTIKINPSFTVQ